MHPPGFGRNETLAEAFSRKRTRALRNIMEDSVQKSCWGVTAKAVIGFACIILVVWLVAGVESGATVATAAG